MTVTDEQATKWAWEESKRKQPAGRWRDDRTHEFDLIIKVFAKPELLDDLKPARRDHLVWNIPDIFWDTARLDGYEQKRLQVARLAPDFFARHYADIAGYWQGLDMFWDRAISGVANADRPLVDTIFDALTRQLAIPTRCCQLSALHGFNHLREPRCRPIIRAFIRSCDDEYVRAYAEAAMTFGLM